MCAVASCEREEHLTYENERKMCKTRRRRIKAEVKKASRQSNKQTCKRKRIEIG